MAKLLKNYKGELQKFSLQSNLQPKFELFIENQKLKEENQRLKGLVLRDDLTGLGNSRALENDLKELLQSFDKNQFFKNIGPSVIFLDLDHFKSVNQLHGHLAASEILKRVGRRLQRVLRETDKIYRYGGDEFVVLVPKGGVKSAQILAKRILNVLSQTPFEIFGFQGVSQVSVTASLGVRVIRPDDTASRLLSEADRALFEAKKTSRNTVVVSAA